MRHIGRCEESVTLLECCLRVAYSHFEGSFGNVCCLPVWMVVESTDGAWLEPNAHEHQVRPMGEHLPLDSLREARPRSFRAVYKRDFRQNKDRR